MSDKSKSNTSLYIQTIFRLIDLDKDDKISYKDISKFKKTFSTVDITWIENIARESDISYQKFYKTFQNSYTICYDKRSELKSNVDQGVSNLQNILKKSNYERLDLYLEINCNDAKLTFRHSDSSKQFKYTKKLISNISFYTIDVKSYNESFYIVNDKNEEYLFQLNEYFVDLFNENDKEISIFKTNKTNILLHLSSKNEDDEEYESLKQKIKTVKDTIRQIKDQIKKFEELLIKIKDYKSQNPVEYLSTISELFRLAIFLSDNNKDITSPDNKKTQVKKSFTQNFSKNSNKIPVKSTPHFGNEKENVQDQIRDTGVINTNHVKISEFQTDDLEVSRNESLNNLSNIDFLKNLDDDYTKAKPINPLSIMEEQEKSMDTSQISATSNSIISENKLHAYAQKTKKITMDNIKSFKSFKTLNFKKNNKIENKYDDEFNNMDEKNKAVYNACESLSSNVQTTKSSTNVNFTQTKTVSNPFNISSKINKYHKQTTFNPNEFKESSFKFKEETTNEKDIDNLTTTSQNEQKNLNDINNNSLLENLTNNTFSRSKTLLLDNSLIEKNEERKSSNDTNNQNYVIIDSKLKALVSDPKIKAERVIKTGSLLSLLNIGIKATPIFSSSKVNIAEMYLVAKKRKEENND